MTVLDLDDGEMLLILGERAEAAYRRARLVVFDFAPDIPADDLGLNAGQRRILADLEEAESALNDFRCQTYDLSLHVHPR